MARNVRQNLTSLSPSRPRTPESFVDARMVELIGTYERARFRIQIGLNELGGDITQFQRWRMTEQLKQLNGIVADLNDKVKTLTPSMIKSSYKRGTNITAQTASELGVSGTVNFGSRINTQSVAVLTDQMARDLLGANLSMKRTIPNFIRATQQRVMEDRQISGLIAEGVVTGETRRATSDALYQALQANIKEGKFIRINGRNYRPEDYAELVARTRTRQFELIVEHEDVIWLREK